MGERSVGRPFLGMGCEPELSVAAPATCPVALRARIRLCRLPAGPPIYPFEMRRKLSTDRGRELYAQRKITLEPVFGQIRYNRRIDRFMRRGRAAAQSEWWLVAATHNILKLHSHWIASTA
jgi:hypothetical protein